MRVTCARVRDATECCPERLWGLGFSAIESAGDAFSTILGTDAGLVAVIAAVAISDQPATHTEKLTSRSTNPVGWQVWVDSAVLTVLQTLEAVIESAVVWPMWGRSQRELNACRT